MADDWEDYQTERKELKSTAVRYLIHYDEMRREYERRKAEALSQPHGDNVGGKSNWPGDPVASRVVNSISYDEKHAEHYWIEAVDMFLKKGAGTRKKIFLEARRAVEREIRNTKGQHAWVVATQMQYIGALRERYKKDEWISERSVRETWSNMVQSVINIRNYLAEKNKR